MSGTVRPRKPGEEYPTILTPYYCDDKVVLYQGDCIDVLAELADESVDAVITDPPYGIAFMGQEWDQPGEFSSRRRPSGPNHRRGHRDAALNAGLYDLSPEAMRNFQRFCTAWATECLRVLKPGGHLLAFGGSRTWHRLSAGIEDAGFEIRDSIAWLYGSGFPKSLNVSKAIDKAAGAQREIIGQGPFAARRPNADHASQGLTYADDSYVRPAGQDITAPATDAAKQWDGWGTTLKPAFEPIVLARKPLQGKVAANVLKHHTGALNIDACRVGENGGCKHTGNDARPTCSINSYGDGLNGRESQPVAGLGRWPTNVVLDEQQAAELDQQSGTLKSGANPTRRGPDAGRTTFGDFAGQAEGGAHRGADEGGASRFFPVFRYTAKAGAAERPTVDGIAHPTVKPLELMRWLIRLVTPPGGVVLDPFGGSGTTGEAAIHEHKRAILIEREPSYLPLIVARLIKPMAVGFDFEAGA